MYGLILLNSLFGCVCQPIINEYDDDDDDGSVLVVPTCAVTVRYLSFSDI